VLSTQKSGPKSVNSYFDLECICILTFYIVISPEELAAKLHTQSKDIVPIAALVRNNNLNSERAFSIWKKVLKPFHYFQNFMLLITRAVLFHLRLSFFTFTAL